MAKNIRFIDNLKVGAYAITDEGTLTIDSNINNYVLTATGNSNIQGEALLQFDGTNLGIGGPSNGARFEINDNTSRDLVLIKASNNQGIKIDNTGILSVIKFSSLPTAVAGGIAYTSNNFYVGL